jgi:dihydroxyacetone kinase
MPADKLAESLVASIVEDLSVGRGERVALLVNGLGATPEMELAIVLRAAHESLVRREVIVERAWAGTFLSAIDMPGCSISILKLDDEKLAFLDAPTEARAWPRLGRVSENIHVASPASSPEAALPVLDANGRAWAARLQPALHSVAETLLANESKFAELDSVAGDGDLGASMKRAANSILEVPLGALGTPSCSLAALSSALRKAIAGSSGPFYATALMRASRRLVTVPNPTPHDWADAFRDAVEAIGQLGGAKAGDRTMLDALVPAANAFDGALEDGKDGAAAWAAAVAAAEQGANETTNMTPRAGRASYLGERAVGAPDAGAVAAASWLRALVPHVR